jgi:hypothetical protein
MRCVQEVKRSYGTSIIISIRGRAIVWEIDCSDIAICETQIVYDLLKTICRPR